MVDEAQDLMPAQIALLKHFCPNLDGFAFAGDTAQTIAKGVEFQFEELRRVFFEHFIIGDLPAKPKVQAPIRYDRCWSCNIAITEIGGKRLECSNCMSEFCACSEPCLEALERACLEPLRKGCTKAVKRQLETAKSWGKIPCLTCHMATRKENVVPPKVQAAEPERQQRVISHYTAMPKIFQLRHNHRSSGGIVFLASSLVQLIYELFPGRIDRLDSEVPQVSSARPVALVGIKVDDAKGLLAGTVSGLDISLEFGVGQAILTWSTEEKKQVGRHFPRGFALTVEEAKGLEFSDVLLWRPFSTMSDSVANGWKLWKYVDSTFTLGGDADLLCSWLKMLYVGITRARRRCWIFEDKDAGAAMLNFWAQKELITIIRGQDGLPHIEGGFARQSTSQDWLDHGCDLMSRARYGHAEHAFGRARELGDPSLDPYVEWARSEKSREQASNEASGPERIRLLQQAAWGFTRLARLGKEAPNRRPRELWRAAADCRAELGDFAAAAFCYREAGRLVDAGECHERLEMWREAAVEFDLAGDKFRALRCWASGDLWTDAHSFLVRGSMDSGDARTLGVQFLRWAINRPPQSSVPKPSDNESAQRKIFEWCLTNQREEWHKHGLEAQQQRQLRIRYVEDLPYMQFQLAWMMDQGYNDRAFAVLMKLLPLLKGDPHTHSTMKETLSQVCSDGECPDLMRRIDRAMLVDQLCLAPGKPGNGAVPGDLSHGHTVLLRFRQFMATSELQRNEELLAQLWSDFDAFARSTARPSISVSHFLQSTAPSLILSNEALQYCADLMLAVAGRDDGYVVVGTFFAAGGAYVLSAEQLAKLAASTLHVSKVSVALRFAETIAVGVRQLVARERVLIGGQMSTALSKLLRDLLHSVSALARFAVDERFELENALDTLGKRARRLLQDVKCDRRSILERIDAGLLDVRALLHDMVLLPLRSGAPALGRSVSMEGYTWRTDVTSLPSTAVFEFLTVVYDRRSNRSGRSLTHPEAQKDAWRLLALELFAAKDLGFFDHLLNSRRGLLRLCCDEDPAYRESNHGSALRALECLATSCKIQLAASREASFTLAQNLRGFLLHQRHALGGDTAAKTDPEWSAVWQLEPTAVAFFLERLLTWATVGITELSNTVLPTSYVRMHLHSHEKLALAFCVDCRSLRWKELRGLRGQCYDAVKQVRDIVRYLFSDYGKFREWLKQHACRLGEKARGDSNEVCEVLQARFITVYFVTRAQGLTKRTLQRYKWESFAPIADQGLPSVTGGHPLAKLASCPPRDPRETMPMLHVGLCDLGDPLVAMFRDDSSPHEPATWLPTWADQGARVYYCNREWRCEPLMKHTVLFGRKACDFTSIGATAPAQVARRTCSPPTETWTPIRDSSEVMNEGNNEKQKCTVVLVQFTGAAILLKVDVFRSWKLAWEQGRSHKQTPTNPFEEFKKSWAVSEEVSDLKKILLLLAGETGPRQKDANDALDLIDIVPYQQDSQVFCRKVDDLRNVIDKLRMPWSIKNYGESATRQRRWMHSRV